MLHVIVSIVQCIKLWKLLFFSGQSSRFAKLGKEKKVETAEVIFLEPENFYDAVSMTPDPCHEVVVLTSGEPSSSGICTQYSSKSKAELLEELRQEKEAREKLEASMKRLMECLDSELSCSICSEVF